MYKKFLLMKKLPQKQHQLKKIQCCLKQPNLPRHICELHLSVLPLFYAGNALARVQRVHEPAELLDITICTRCFETQSSPGCPCTHRSKFLTHSLNHQRAVLRYRKVDCLTCNKEKRTGDIMFRCFYLDILRDIKQTFQ